VLAPLARKLFAAPNNTFVGRDHWENNDHTFMMVLNKYDEIKAGGYGNFGRLIEGTQ
jgi:hypothetical protein